MQSVEENWHLRRVVVSSCRRQAAEGGQRAAGAVTVGCRPAVL